MSENGRDISRYADNFAYEPLSSRERIVALVLAALLLAANIAITPVARLHLGVVPAFLPVIETAAFIGLSLTAAMLYSQYRVGRHAPLAILACAFGTFGVLQAPYLMTFPGVFTPNGLLGSGAQTAVWFYVMSRVGFASLVLAYIFFEWHERSCEQRSHSYVVPIATAASTFVAGLLIFLTLGHALLPTLIVSHGGYSPVYPRVVVPAVIASFIVAFAALLLVTGLRARVHAWLAIMLLSGVCELSAAGLLSGGRYSLGWYVARADLAIDATLFLFLMHAQLASILSRSAESGERAHSVYEFISFGHKNLAKSNEEMLAFAKRNLGFEWAFIARIDADELRVESSVGDSPYLNTRRRPRELALMREALAKKDLLVADVHAKWSGGALQAVPGLSYAAMPIVVDDEPYGVIGFGSTKRRSRALSDADRNFIRLVGVLAGSNIERARHHRKLDELAFFDALTGLPNRALLMDRLQQAVATAKRRRTSFNVYFLDVDYFKPINDRFGHAAGDEVLREVSRRLSKLVRESDTVARLGGDEFVVITPDVAGRDEAAAASTRIARAFEEPVRVAAVSLAVGMSVGASTFPVDGEDAAALLRRADEALYRAKSNRIVVHSALEVTAIAATAHGTT